MKEKERRPSGGEKEKQPSGEEKKVCKASQLSARCKLLLRNFAFSSCGAPISQEIALLGKHQLVRVVVEAVDRGPFVWVGAGRAEANGQREAERGGLRAVRCCCAGADAERGGAAASAGADEALRWWAELAMHRGDAAPRVRRGR